MENVYSVITETGNRFIGFNFKNVETTGFYYVEGEPPVFEPQAGKATEIFYNTEEDCFYAVYADTPEQPEQPLAAEKQLEVQTENAEVIMEALADVYIAIDGIKNMLREGQNG